jgi:hypothetical protein
MSGNNGPKPLFSAEDRKKIINLLLSESINAAAIGKRFGVSAQTIRRIHWEYLLTNDKRIADNGDVRNGSQKRK